TAPLIKRVHLDHARAADVSTMAKELSAATGPGQGGGGGGRRGGGGGQVSGTADSRGKSGSVGGRTKEVECVEGHNKDLDVDCKGSTIKQFVVKGDAGAIASQLKSVFITGQGQSDIIISGDANSGMVIVKAAEPQMKEIETQINLLEERIGISKELRN